MSTAVEEAVMTPRESAEFYTPLVKEYAEKLGGLCKQAHEIRFHYAQHQRANAGPEMSTEAARLIDVYESLKPVVGQLLRRTSDILDLARDKIGRDYELALALHQEELEAHVRFAPTVFAELEAAFGANKVRPIIERTRVKLSR